MSTVKRDRGSPAPAPDDDSSWSDAIPTAIVHANLLPTLGIGGWVHMRLANRKWLAMCAPYVARFQQWMVDRLPLALVRVVAPTPKKPTRFMRAQRHAPVAAADITLAHGDHGGGGNIRQRLVEEPYEWMRTHMNYDVDADLHAQHENMHPGDISHNGGAAGCSMRHRLAVEAWNRHADNGRQRFTGVMHANYTDAPLCNVTVERCDM